MKKNKLYFDGASLTENEKAFLLELMPLFNDKLLSMALTRFRDLLKEIRTSDVLDPAKFPLMKGILDALKLHQIPEFTPKLVRAIEILSAGDSVSPLTNNAGDWVWSSYYQHYHHRGSRNITRKEIDGPIWIIDHIHHFPKPDFAFWQAYAVPRMLRRNEFPLDPLTLEVKETYYKTPWDGRGSVNELIGSAKVLRYPEYASGWLAIQRSGFVDKEERLDKIIKDITEGE